MFDEIVKDIVNRIAAQPDSRCASADEVRICWLVSEITNMQKRIVELEQEVKRLSERDCNASVQLSYPSAENPFETEQLTIVDVGVADNTYVVESRVLNDALKRIAELEATFNRGEK